MSDSIVKFDYRKHFDDALSQTQQQRQRSSRVRDYYDNIQYSENDKKNCKGKKNTLTINIVQSKVNFLVGSEQQGRTDPRAFPRTPKHEQLADVASDALRFVNDNTKFDYEASKQFRQALCEGIEACIVEVDARNEIKITGIPYDRFYYDPYSKREDFADARYMGVVAWFDEADAIGMFPEAEDVIKASYGANASESSDMEDKPSVSWADAYRKRIMIMQEYFIHDGVWHEVYYCWGGYIVSPRPSPYLNEYGEPICPIIAASPLIDRENNRYGYASLLIDLQDEVNRRRSKALDYLNKNQVIHEKGAILDIRKFKKAKEDPAGTMEVAPDALKNGRFMIPDNTTEMQAHFQFYQSAKADLDMLGGNAALVGKEERDLSGRAITALQQSGMTELNHLFDIHSFWKNRVFTNVWYAIKQFWTQERWIRVTDEEDSHKFIAINRPITMGEQIQAQYGQIPEHLQGHPSLQQVVAVENQFNEVDVDIMVDQSPDQGTLRSEMYQLFINAMQATQGNPEQMKMIVNMMPTFYKRKEVIDMLDQQLASAAKNGQVVQQMQQQQAQTELGEKQAKTQKDMAQAEKYAADAQKTLSEVYRPY